MIIDFLIYLFEVSLATGLLAVLYKLLFAKLTFFNWNRWYILGGLVAALLMPLLPVSYNLGWSVFQQQQALDSFWLMKPMAIRLVETDVPGSGITGDTPPLSFGEITPWFLLMVYACGAVYKIYELLRSLFFVFNLRASATQMEATGRYKIYTQGVLASFSFGRSVFLHSNTEILSVEELELVVRHELAHVKLRHTRDIMVMEIAGVFFWFNPFLAYLSKSLRALHEYQADAYVAGNEMAMVNYGKLIIKLASARPSFSLIHTFSDSQIFDRIKMLTKPKSNSMKKLRFLWSVPAMAMIVLLYSCLEREKVSSGDFAAKSASGETFKATGLKIGKISWEGNTKYTDQELNSILGVAPGDACDTIQIYAALNGGATPNGKDLLSLYMDRGYLFFRVEPKIKVNGNIADISIRVYEGSIAKIGKVTFSGIKKVNALELIEKIETKPGELFSRIKLINSQRILSEMGKFDPKDIQINPIPDWQSSDKDGIIKTDIVFKVREI